MNIPLALFWVCAGGVVLNLGLYSFSSKIPDAEAGQFLINTALFMLGAVVNYTHLPKPKQ